MRILTWQLNRTTYFHHPVILANAGIQSSQGFFWIPALRSAAAGMTSLVAGLIIRFEDIETCPLVRVPNRKVIERRKTLNSEP